MTRRDIASRKIRVLHFIQSCGVYGAESVILNLSREMKADGRYEPVIGCIVDGAESKADLVEAAEAQKIEAHHFAVANSRVWLDLPRVALQIRRLKIDVIHCHGYKPSVYAYLIGKMTGIRAMATCHLWFIEDDAPWKMRAMIRVEKFLYRHFPAVVAVSDKIRDTLIAAGAKQTKVHLVRNGIAMGDFQIAEPAARKDNEFRVLNVARLAQQKGQCYLVAAAKIIKQARRDVRILIVGEGELRDELQQQIKEEQVEDIVTLVGFRSDVREMLQDSDLFVLSSLDEGMPISLLEAVATKVPAVVTPVGDIPKLIVDGETGLVVEKGKALPLAEAILSLAGNSKSRTELADRAWVKMRDVYSSAQMFARYDAIYREVLKIDQSDARSRISALS